MRHALQVIAGCLLLAISANAGDSGGYWRRGKSKDYHHYHHIIPYGGGYGHGGYGHDGYGGYGGYGHGYGGYGHGYGDYGYYEKGKGYGKGISNRKVKHHYHYVWPRGYGPSLYGGGGHGKGGGGYGGHGGGGYGYGGYDSGGGYGGHGGGGGGYGGYGGGGGGHGGGHGGGKGGHGGGGGGYGGGNDDYVLVVPLGKGYGLDKGYGGGHSVHRRSVATPVGTLEEAEVPRVTAGRRATRSTGRQAAQRGRIEGARSEEGHQRSRRVLEERGRGWR